MVTIKDVAKLAGVSVGTVSNVINGKTKNTELIEKVENAIGVLGFRPDSKARSLKRTSSDMIGVVIGSLRDEGMDIMLSEIERYFKSRGFHILLKVTDNNLIRERKQVEDLLAQGVAGVIINSCPDKREWSRSLRDSETPVAFLEHGIKDPENTLCVQADYEESFFQCFTYYRKQGIEDIDVILRENMIEKDVLERMAENVGINLRLRLAGANVPENGFKETFELLQGVSTPSDRRLLITAGSALLQGAMQAIRLLEKQDQVTLACIKSENWTEDGKGLSSVIDISYGQMAYEVSENLYENILKKGRKNHFIKLIPGRFRLCREEEQPVMKRGKKTDLTIALLDSSQARVYAEVAKVYEKQTGVALHFRYYQYHELWELAKDPARLKKEKISALMYDIVWKQELYDRGILQVIGRNELPGNAYLDDYIDESLESTGYCKGELIGLPFLTGTQMLFYQKDLFEDENLKRQFMQKYGYELEVPENWDSFRNVCEFFTREWNPRSPVKYGSAFLNEGNMYNSIAFLNILWSMGDDVIKNDDLNLDTPAFMQSLKLYRSLNRYSAKGEFKDWEDIAEAFRRGELAMAILYDSLAYGINEPLRSEVAGNVESAMIPGAKPVLGGWGMGLFHEAEDAEQTREFIFWSCGPECDRIFSVLSGTSGRKGFYQNKDLEWIYPWKKNVLDSYAVSRSRKCIPSEENNCMLFYDRILGKGLGDLLRGSLTEEELPERIKKEWDRLRKEK